MNGKYILAKDGKTPIECDDLKEWGRWMNGDERIVRRTEVGEVTVSTVFLGLDHNFTDWGPPQLWETMIFGGKHDGRQWRYTSREAAENGHDSAVVMAQGGLDG